MNKKERERIKTLLRLEEGLITQSIAAQQLNVGIRQIQRLIKSCPCGERA